MRAGFDDFLIKPFTSIRSTLGLELARQWQNKNHANDS